jgi:UDP-4-amino-4,6-dideoxy-L-N-acetyl-beta-L-altrosamine transaminase
VNKVIPYSRQSIDQDDISEVVSILESDYLTQGPAIAKFESAIAEYTGAKYCVVFSSGTAALHAAYFASGLGEGDEIITSPITFVATSNAVLYLRAKPVFSDIEPDTANIDIGKIEEKINKNTKILVPVHYAGHPVDLANIRTLGDKYGLMVIEDACHSLGAQYKGGQSKAKNQKVDTRNDEWKRIGSCTHSDMTILSFHPVKHIATGEGGAVLTQNKHFYDRLLMFRSHGITKNRINFTGTGAPGQGEWYYEMQLLGYNYRMTDIQAALGYSQLTKIERFVEARREIVVYYNNAFQDNPHFDIPTERDYSKSSYHLYTIRLKEHLVGKRASIFARLREEGLGVQVLYIPVYLQPYYQKIGYKAGLCPVAEDFYSKAISIPIYHGLTETDRDEVVKRVLRVLKEEEQS